MKEFIIKKKITINAEPSEVWDALTNPEKTKKYFFNCMVHSNWKVGSPITFSRKILWFTFSLKGKIVKIEREKMLQYTLVNTTLFRKPDTSKYSFVTDELSFENGKTTLAISDDVSAYEGAEKRYAKSDKGWDKILKGLKELVEEKK